MHAVPAAELDERRAGVMLFEDRDDLRLGESRLAHGSFLSAISAGKPTILFGPDFRGYVDPIHFTFVVFENMLM
jgi:hypothetical protein